MKIYAAVHNYDSFDHGCYEDILGLFSTWNKAKSYLESRSDWKNYILVREGLWKLNDWDQDKQYYEIVKFDLDKGTDTTL